MPAALNTERVDGELSKAVRELKERLASLVRLLRLELYCERVLAPAAQTEWVESIAGAEAKGAEVARGHRTLVHVTAHPLDLVEHLAILVLVVEERPVPLLALVVLVPLVLPRGEHEDLAVVEGIRPLLRCRLPHLHPALDRLGRGGELLTHAEEVEPLLLKANHAGDM